MFKNTSARFDQQLLDIMRKHNIRPVTDTAFTTLYDAVFEALATTTAILHSMEGNHMPYLDAFQAMQKNDRYIQKNGEPTQLGHDLYAYIQEKLQQLPLDKAGKMLLDYIKVPQDSPSNKL